MFNSSNNNNNSSPNGVSENFEDFQKNLFGKLVSATKISNGLPTSEDDYSYYETFPEFKNRMGHLGKRLLNLTQNFVYSENPRSSINLTDTDDTEELSYRFNGIVDLVDGIIDRVDKTIDPKYSNADLIGQQQQNIYLSSTKGANNNEKNMFYGNHILRPQSKFQDLIDNTNFPFQPKIKSKANAMVALDPAFLKAYEIAFGGVSKSKDLENLTLPHPYEYEIQNYQYLPRQLQPCREQLYKGLEETPYTWIERDEDLDALIEKLKYVEEIAVDLENHSYRSYQGFVCLMQISTRTEDFIVDTLALRASIHKLNLVFTDPKIVKVLHGSDSDVKWLQRDFGVYIVNMFDTGQASRVLEYPSASLAFLLKLYCGVDANKKYQLADWRIRSIPSEMIKYAREDTHYLLYIYDRLRNELLVKGNSKDTYIQQVLARSRELSLLRYEKEVLDESSHITFAQKLNLPYAPAQMAVLRVLYHWRENIAREEDESIRYVLPNQIMYAIVEKSPNSVADLLSVSTTIPPLLKLHAHAILQEIFKSRIEATKQPIINQITSTLSAAALGTNNQSNIFYQKTSTNISTPNNISSSTLTTAYSHTNVPTTPQQQQQINNHTNSNSPVLSTDQLYKTAKWLSSDIDINLHSNFQQSLITPLPLKKSAMTAPVNSANHSNQPFSNSLFDSSDESGTDIDNRKSKRVASMISTSFEQSTFAPVFKPTQFLKSFDQTHFKSAAEQIMGGSDEMEEDDDDDNDDDDDVEEANDDALPAKEHEVEVTSDDNKSTKSLDDEDRMVEDDDDDDDDDDESSNQVPKSMQEIYQLSNMNRRRNKEKKKLKENSYQLSTSPNSNTMILESSSGIAPPKSSKKEDQSGPGTLNFLKEIGWISHESESLNSFGSQQTTPGTIQGQQAQTSNTGGSGHQQPKSKVKKQQQQQQPNKQQLQQSQQSQQQQQQYQQVSTKQQQQPFISFDYASISQQQQQQAQQQQQSQQQSQFFNVDFQATGKKRPNSNNTKAKSGSYTFTGNSNQYHGGRGKK